MSSKVLVYLIILFEVCGVAAGVCSLSETWHCSPFFIAHFPINILWGRGDVGERKGNLQELRSLVSWFHF